MNDFGEVDFADDAFADFASGPTDTSPRSSDALAMTVQDASAAPAASYMGQGDPASAADASPASDPTPSGSFAQSKDVPGGFQDGAEAGEQSKSAAAAELAPLSAASPFLAEHADSVNADRGWPWNRDHICKKICLVSLEAG